MNRKISCLLAIGLLTGVLLTTPVHAQRAEANASTSSDAKDPKAVRVPFTGKLSAVDKAGMSITLEGKTKKRTIHVTPHTKIVKAGKPATLEEAAIGDEVGGQAIKNTEGQEEAVSLRLGVKTEGEPKQKKRAKGEPPADK